ncbi:DUF523 domain-containing protein [Pseudoalteromonas sp. OOF1S-7]|uniref:DUF523 domain-containing protein n=1 Tax=Pseudoalteromonas sp. OOF1S-7 TaxID=2917757 RepID=UPI001EF4201F|nr:DUF523 domain-containing protein [Pseudoalteromonas sp. OOF1S-7]MCG7534585.1 DUF523 domain-containing protein [Pseudoalteromonas sp. OOF1S-7]
MEKVLVSACLLGNKVRYNASCLSIPESDLHWLQSNMKLVVLCPEVSAGLPTPRAPAEIITGQGLDVLNGSARVVESNGSDVTAPFIKGAENALALCQQQQIKYAVLAQGSPSCGSTQIYDGTFSGVKTNGAGVTAALLARSGIKVFSQHAISQLRDLLQMHGM